MRRGIACIAAIAVLGLPSRVPQLSRRRRVRGRLGRRYMSEHSSSRVQQPCTTSDVVWCARYIITLIRVRPPTFSSISRSAAEPIISRSRSASALLSIRPRKLIISSGAIGFKVGVNNPTLPCPATADDHRLDTSLPGTQPKGAEGQRANSIDPGVP